MTVLGKMAHDADEAAQAAAVGALDACMDCGLLADLDLGEDDVADVTDKVYSKIVDEAAAPALRAACLGLALLTGLLGAIRGGAMGGAMGGAATPKTLTNTKQPFGSATAAP